MTIKITAFSAIQSNYTDKRSGDFALVFEEKARRAPFFGNVLVDAMWCTWMPHAAFPLNKGNAQAILEGHDSPYPDSALLHFKANDAVQAKAALHTLMTTWAEGNSRVMGYSEEESIALAYRDMESEGFFVFIYCSYMKPHCIHEAFKSISLRKKQYTLVQTEEERSGSDFLSSMRDNDIKWFNTLERIGIIDENCVILDELEDDD